MSATRAAAPKSRGLAEGADAFAAIFELGHVGSVYYGYGQLLSYANLERWRRATRASRESHPGAFFQAYGADGCIVHARRRLRDDYEERESPEHGPGASRK